MTQPYIHHTGQFRFLLVSAFFLFAGNGLFLNSAGVKLAQMGVDNFIIGTLNAAFFLGAVVCGLAAHRVVSRIGHIRSFSVFGALFAVSALAHTMSASLAAWGVIRFGLGFAYYSLLMVVESWIAEKIVPNKKSRLLAIYNIVYYIAFSLGSALMGLNLVAERIFTLSAVLVILAMLPVCLTLTDEPVLPPHQRISIPRVLDIAPLASIGSLIGGILVNGFFTMASVYVLDLGYGVKEVSYFVMSAMIGGFVVQFPVAYLSDTLGRRLTLMMMVALAAMGVVCGHVGIVLGHHAIGWQYGYAFLFGFGTFTIYSLCLARASDVLNQKNTTLTSVGISRSILFIWGIGSLIGPMVLGLAMKLNTQYGFNLLLLAGCVLLIVAAFRQPSVPKALRRRYVGRPPADSGGLAEKIELQRRKQDMAQDAVKQPPESAPSSAVDSGRAEAEDEGSAAAAANRIG